MGRKKGITLVEVILAMVFILAIISASTYVMMMATKGVEGSNKEFVLQSSIKVAAETVTQKVRYSTALFTVPQSSFSPSNLTDDWDYFGIEDVDVDGVPASQIVEYKYNTATLTHDKKIVIEARKDIKYELIFKQADPNTYIDGVSGEEVTLENRMLEYQIIGILNGDRDNPYVVVTGQTEALNSLQIVDSGTESDRATAIAYRADNRAGAELYVGHVAMILDCSGSMDFDMNGGTAATTADKRIEIMKNAANGLLLELSSKDYVDVSIIPFSSSANNPRPFKNAQSELADLQAIVNGLVADGGTNTGDAIRRAYYQLRDHNATVSAGVTAVNYLIILVDGETTMASVKSRSQRTEYFMNDGNINYGDVGNLDWMPIGQEATDAWGNGTGTAQDFYSTAYRLYWYDSDFPADCMIIGGGNFRLNFTSTYVTQLATTRFSNDNFAKPYIVFFSPSITESGEGIAELRDAFNCPPENMFSANNGAELNQAFTNIQRSILGNLWHLNGPSL